MLSSCLPVGPLVDQELPQCWVDWVWDLGRTRYFLEHHLQIIARNCVSNSIAGTWYVLGPH